MKRNEEENWTSVSTGYATFSAEDISHYDKSDNTTPDNMLLSGDVRYYGNPMNWESTKGDLISREALKKDFKERFAKCDEWIEKAKDKETRIRASAVKAFIAEVIMTIDNAPTVEPKLKDDIIEAFNLITDQEFEHSDSFWIETPKGKKIEFEKKRPQGEWIRTGSLGNGNARYECSNCHRGDVQAESQEVPYCWHCGAKMQKGGAE